MSGLGLGHRGNAALLHRDDEELVPIEFQDIARDGDGIHLRLPPAVINIGHLLLRQPTDMKPDTKEDRDHRRERLAHET